MTVFKQFVIDSARSLFRGGPVYKRWVGLLVLLIGWGLYNYSQQWQLGLQVTNMSDQVSWGFYIANFAFFVGIAAAAVLLVIPAYIFHRKDIKPVVLIAEGMAVAAVIVALTCVLTDLGRLDRAWHLLPIFGWYHWPASILSWDVLVLNGYLLLSLFIPMYVLFNHYQNKEPNINHYFAFVVLAMFWAISIHTVTAFVFASNSGRPFWNTALLAPRFIASAFAAGPALLILALQAIRRFTTYHIEQSVIRTLAIIMAVTMQINLYFVISEFFVDFYNEGQHAASIHYLFFGLDGFDSLKGWIWTALTFNVIAVLLLMVHKTRNNMTTLNIAAVLGFLGIWIEKGMGLVVPGYIPTPLGEIYEYAPSFTEVSIVVGIWSLGALIFTLAAKTAIAIEEGEVAYAGDMGREGGSQRTWSLPIPRLDFSGLFGGARAPRPAAVGYGYQEQRVQAAPAPVAQRPTAPSQPRQVRRLTPRQVRRLTPRPVPTRRPTGRRSGR